MPIPQIEKKQPKKGKKSTQAPRKHTRSKGKKGKNGKKRRSWLHRIFLMAVVFGLFGALGVGIVFAVVAQELPDPNKISDRAVAQSTRIFARDGETLLYEIHGDENRTLIDIETIPDYAVQATVAIEDDEFYTHHGIDWKGILRAAGFNILSGDATGQGGSTLTQQFVKNAIVGTEQTYTRKLKEVVLAIELEQIYTKEEILQLYFNEIPYGSTAYGIESASQLYFDVSASELTLPQAATLAAMPQRPTYFSPYGSNVDKLLDRKDTVLDRMADLDYITEEEAEAAKAEEIVFAERREDISSPHFVFYVRELLAEKYGEKTLEQGGLKVVTTLDPNKQSLAEQAVLDGMEKIRGYGGENAALVSIDAHNGEILAMVGSYDYFSDTIDGQVNVTIRERQPGSSFKPIAYLTAFENGYTPNTVLWDVETDFPIESGNYHPRNYSLGQAGPISMGNALRTSLNIPAVKTLYLAGIDTVLDNAEKLGYTTFSDRSRYGLALVLGGGEVTLLEHTSAFATLAREGERHPANAILSIEDSTGEKIFEQQARSEDTVDPNAVRHLNKALAGGWISLDGGRPVTAKTGTTNDYRDAWTIGYTPSVATGVWVGNNNNSEMYNGAAGLIVATPIFEQYMNSVLAGTPVETFNAPETSGSSNPAINGSLLSGETRIVDSETGKVIPDECLEEYPEEFKAEKEFKIAHSILYYVNREDPTSGIPSNPASDPHFNAWESAVQNYATAKEDSNFIKSEEDLEYEDCSFRDQSITPKVSISSPTGTVDINDFSIKVKIKAGKNREIAKVEYFIDGNIVDTKTEEPFTSTYSAFSLTGGRHTLTVIATDNAGVSAEASSDFTFQADEGGTLGIISPSSGDVVLPATIRAYVPNPEDAEVVKFYHYDSETGGDHVLIGEANNPSSNYVETLWLSAPEKGGYTLYVKVTNSDGSIDRSSNVSVTVQ